MSLEARLATDIATAMKAKDTVKLATFRMLKAALTNKSIEKGRALEPAEELQVVASLVKQRRDSIEQFTAGNRPDLAEKERAEIAVLETLQPPAASHGSGAGTGSVVVTTDAGCSWTAARNSSWITISSGGSGTGSGSVSYSVSANQSESSRQGSLTIAGLTFTVSQEGSSACSYSIAILGCLLGLSADQLM